MNGTLNICTQEHSKSAVEVESTIQKVFFSKAKIEILGRQKCQPQAQQPICPTSETVKKVLEHAGNRQKRPW